MKQAHQRVELIDLAYAAGFIEADGCFHINGTSIGIRVTNKKMAVLDWFVEHFGGAICSKSTPSNCWNWNLHGKAAEELIKILYPLLKIKKYQADILLEYRALPSVNGVKLPEETRIKRLELKKLLQETR